MSNYLKIYRATVSDEDFAARVRTACIVENIEYEENSTLTNVANQVVAKIDLSPEGTISTERVEDADILKALQILTGDAEEEGEA